jgi:hypothetical protein
VPVRRTSPGALEEQGPGGEQFDTALGAAQQGDAELLLDLLDLARQGRLRNGQARGSTAEMQFLGDGLEVAQLADVDHVRLADVRVRKNSNAEAAEVAQKAQKKPKTISSESFRGFCALPRFLRSKIFDTSTASIRPLLCIGRTPARTPHSALPCRSNHPARAPCPSSPRPLRSTRNPSPCRRGSAMS